MNLTLVVQFRHHYYLQGKKKKSKLTLVIYVFDDFFSSMALQIEPKALYMLGKLYQ